MKKLIPVLFLAIIVSSCTNESTSLTEFLVSIEDSVNKDITDGRLLLYISDNNEREPRFQVRDGYLSQQVFGIDVENWMEGSSQLIGAKVFGYPLENMTELPPGKYYVQFDKTYKSQVKDLMEQGNTKEVAETAAPVLEEARKMLRSWE